jgi:hypothetical protein
MNLPFTLPDWLPDWAFLLLALPALLYALAFILMPFSVFGVKARLDALEGQIDSLHEEVRNLAIRSSGVLGGGRLNLQEAEPYDPMPNFSRLKSSQKNFAETPAAPPVPPPVQAAPLPALTPVVEPRRQPVAAKPQLPQRPPRRMEPRLD